jgi:hypothetical protein
MGKPARTSWEERLSSNGIDIKCSKGSELFHDLPHFEWNLARPEDEMTGLAISETFAVR